MKRPQDSRSNSLFSTIQYCSYSLLYYYLYIMKHLAIIAALCCLASARKIEARIPQTIELEVAEPLDNNDMIPTIMSYNRYFGIFLCYKTVRTPSIYKLCKRICRVLIKET